MTSKLSVRKADGISAGVLVTLAALDVATVCGMYCLRGYVWSIIVLYSVCAAFIWLFAKWVAKAPLMGFSPVILTKLLGNAIAPSKLGVAYLLVFVVHLGWLTDSTFNIISLGHQGFDVRYLVPLCCSIGGLICIVGFFPDPYNKKKEETKKVIVSGMSVINASFWDGLKTAFEKNNINGVRKANIIPLVRMLVKHIGEKDIKLLILKSDQLTRDALLASDVVRKNQLIKDNKNVYELFPFNVEVKENETSQKPTKEEQDRMDKLREELRIASSYFTTSGRETGRDDRMKLYEFYNVDFSLMSKSDNDEYNVFLILMIKMFALFEFPDNLEFIKNVEVEFTEPCNYNNYPNSFDRMADAIQKYDNDKFEMEFNITPGTALVSSVMTLLAIDGDKKLYYHEQVQGNPLPAQDAIQPVDKNKLPLENLLSQALDGFSKMSV